MSSLYEFASTFIPTVVFSSVVYSGDSMDSGKALFVGIMMNKLKNHSIALVRLLSGSRSLFPAMERIVKFYEAPEL